MGKGKYSPCYPNCDSDFLRNCFGDVVEDFLPEDYNEIYHFESYDEQGFDSYGYSAFDKNGEYVGIGQGVDRLGYTEDDYILMTVEEFEDIAFSIKDNDIIYNHVNDILKNKNEIKPK